MKRPLGWIDITIIIFYLLMIISLGFLMKKRASRSLRAYFLGERRLPWWALAMSGSTSYFDITGTMWIVSLFFIMGLKGLWVQCMWGFTLAVFYMAYMGKWIARSNVVTGAEWMRTRFGSGKPGEAARLAYTILAVVTILGFLVYEAEGMGKFGSIFIPLSEHWCAALIIGVTGLYVIVGGLYGVVLVEVVQTVILSAGALIIAYIGYTNVSHSLIMAKVAERASALPGKMATPSVWLSLMPNWKISALSETEYFIFGALVLVWTMKGLLLQFSGPEQLYDFQRFLAAGSARDASKLGMLWGVIHTVRWPMAMGIAVLALVGFRGVGDPEKVLPMVLKDWLPVGLRGFGIAALLSGFLATYNSTVNAGASYLVRDIYQRYINPKASERRLVFASYLSSALLVALGIILSFKAKSIHQMFTWIMIALGTGIVIPNVLRWYWWRFNGWGFTAGVVIGILASVLQIFLFPEAPIYIYAPIIVGVSLFGSVIIALLTGPAPKETLTNFYRTVQPAGFWKPVSHSVKGETPEFSKEPFLKRDFVNLVLGLPWVICLYLFPIYLILHQFDKMSICLLAVVLLSFVLYYTWYRNLPKD